MRLAVLILMMLLAAFIAIGGAVPTAMAQAESLKTWEGITGGDWFTPGNWDGGVPGENDVAVIDNGTIPYIGDNETDAECKRLDISTSGSGLLIETDGVLKLGKGNSQTSRLDAGDNVLEVDGVLKIDGEQTFEGAGTIRLTASAATIAAAGSNDLLILTSECISSPISRNCSITLAGVGKVEVAVDNKAFVVADYDSWGDRLRLQDEAKTTSGGAEAYWICENGGTLEVEVSVTGSGHWWVRDVTCSNDPCDRRGHACNGTIVVSGTDACVKGTGDVVLEAGCGHETNGDLDDHQLKVLNNHFCTTGRLEWRSVPFTLSGSTMSKPAIQIEDYFRSASFGVSDLANCPSCPP